MGTFQPIEAFGTKSCGIQVSVAARTTGTPRVIIATEMNTDEWARVVDPRGEGVITPKSEQDTEPRILVVGVASALACAACNLCPPMDYSAVAPSPQYVKVSDLPAVEQAWASKVLDISSIRPAAAACVARLNPQ